MKFPLFLLSFLLFSFSGFSEEKKLKTSVSLEIQKGETLSFKKIPLFFLSAKGLQKGDSFKIIHRNGIGNAMVLLEGIYEGNGNIKKENSRTLVFQDLPMKTFEPFFVGGFYRGEESEFLIIDDKGNLLSQATYLPEPLEVSAVDGAKLAMYHVAKDLYRFEGSHLTPGEKIEFVSLSGAEVIKNFYTVDSSGKLVGNLIANENVPYQSMNVTIKRKNDSLSLNYGSAPSVYAPSRLDNPIVLFTIDHLPSKEEIEITNKLYEKIFLQMTKSNYLKKNP